MDASTHPLYQSALQAMDAILGRDRASAIAVAYSGGLDSSVLLHLMARYGREHGIVIRAFHVHHGLSANADHWLAHCRATCAALEVHFDARQVEVNKHSDNGIEEAARDARYAALGALCMEHTVSLLLTAHHLDDQAETMLLQMLRGAGLAGISGMETSNRAPGLLGTAGVTIARPLLKAARAALEAYATTYQITHIEDESNSDPRFARNALRHQVMPALANAFPGFTQRFARTAQHAQTAQRLLIELAGQDLAVCRTGQALSVVRLRALSPERADNMLRHWFATRGLRKPSTAWLNEMRTQLLIAKADARLCVTHADCHVRRHRDHVYITPRNDELAEDVEPQSFTWNGEACWHFPEYGGSLHFDQTERGIDPGWLRGRSCTIHYRQGGERLKLAPNRPTRDLKHHYQANDIPAWERETLPLVSSQGKLLYAAGLGMDHAHDNVVTEHGIVFRWETG